MWVSNASYNIEKKKDKAYKGGHVNLKPFSIISVVSKYNCAIPRIYIAFLCHLQFKMFQSTFVQHFSQQNSVWAFLHHGPVYVSRVRTKGIPAAMERNGCLLTFTCKTNQSTTTNQFQNCYQCHVFSFFSIIIINICIINYIFLIIICKQ